MAISITERIATFTSAPATQSVSPATLGNCLVVIVNVAVAPGTATLTALSGGGVTEWQHPYPTDADNFSIWYGKITATGAQTLSLTYGGTIAGVFVEIVGIELSDGASREWRTVATGGPQVNGSSTTITYPNLIGTAAAGNQEYVGYAGVSSSATGGTTGGFTQVNLAATGDGYVTGNVATSANVTPTGAASPAATSDAIGIILQAFIFTGRPRPQPAPPPAIPTHSWMQRRYISDPTLLSTALLEGPISVAGPQKTPWRRDAYWSPPAAKFTDPNLLTTSLLEGAISVAGAPKTPWRRDPYWSPPGAPGRDPNQLASALLEDVLLIDRPQGTPWRRDAYWVQRFLPIDPNQFPAGGVDPTLAGASKTPWRRDPYWSPTGVSGKDPALLLTALLEGAISFAGPSKTPWRRDAYWTPPTSPGHDPNQLTAALLEDALLFAGAPDIPWRRDRYWVPPGAPGRDPNQLASALLEDVLLLAGAPRTPWRRDPYWSPPGAPGRDPVELTTALLEGILLLAGAPKTPWRRDRTWTPPPAPGRDPGQLTTALLEDVLLFAGAPKTPWRRDPYWIRQTFAIDPGQFQMVIAVDGFALTLTLRDRGHTATILDGGHDASLRDSGHSTSTREQH